MTKASGVRIFLDPTNESRPPRREPAARLDCIDGKTIGLLDISKPCGSVFLDRVQTQFEERGATVLRFSKPTFTKPAPVDLRHEIATRCDAVIEALAD